MDGSGTEMRAVAGAAKSEHRLSEPADCTDWDFSLESFNGLGENTNCKPTRAMEPEELAHPGMTVHSPDPPSEEVSRDNSQVHTLQILKKKSLALVEIYQQTAWNGAMNV